MLITDLSMDSEDFGKFYTEHYSMLYLIAFEYTRDYFLAEEMVEETFLSLWLKRDSIQINTSIKNYLIKSTQNTCLQYIRKNKQTTLYINDQFAIEHIPWGNDYPLGQLFENELTEIIKKATDALPPQCRTIFMLSRDEEMSYSQIADKLQISENTVKTQMKTALLRLRNALKDYLPLFIISMIGKLYC